MESRFSTQHIENDVEGYPWPSLNMPYCCFGWKIVTLPTILLRDKIPQVSFIVGLRTWLDDRAFL